MTDRLVPALPIILCNIYCICGITFTLCLSLCVLFSLFLFSGTPSFIMFLFLFVTSFIEICFTCHTIYPFKMCGSLVFGILYYSFLKLVINIYNVQFIILTCTIQWREYCAITIPMYFQNFSLPQMEILSPPPFSSPW